MVAERQFFFSECVAWPKHEVQAIIDMIESERRITRETFVAHVDPVDRIHLERLLGYTSRGPGSMAQDGLVRYYSGKLKGRRVYFFRWSAIEYVFTPDGKLKGD